MSVFFFELQNINTLTEAGELLLTILAAFAQAESESASESSKMAYLHRIENGEVVAYLERSYGYEKDENGEYRAKEPEASVIRKIYDLVIQGVNCTNIARVLNARNIQTVQGQSGQRVPFSALWKMKFTRVMFLCRKLL